MRKSILTATICTVFLVGLLLLPNFAEKAQAADKIGWIGPNEMRFAMMMDEGKARGQKSEAIAFSGVRLEA